MGEHVDSSSMATRAYQLASSSTSASRDTAGGGLCPGEGPGEPAYDMLLFDHFSPPFSLTLRSTSHLLHFSLLDLARSGKNIALTSPEAVEDRLKAQRLGIVLRRQTSAPAHFMDDALCVLDEMYRRTRASPVKITANKLFADENTRGDDDECADSTAAAEPSEMEDN